MKLLKQHDAAKLAGGSYPTLKRYVGGQTITAMITGDACQA